MKKLLLFLLIMPLLLSCTKAMRYTYEEVRYYPEGIQEKIKNNEVVTGMTLQQVRYAWGAPSSVEVLEPNSEGKERIQWEYRRVGGLIKTILVFADGKLSEIVNKEPGFMK